MVTEPAESGDLEDVLVAMTPLRRAIGRAMVQSKQQAPHFSVSVEIDAEAAVATLSRRNADRPGGPKVTLTARLLQDVAATLRSHPRFNAVWTDEGLVEKRSINLGVAVAVDGGIVAPAIIGADRMSIDDLGAAVADLAMRARAGGLRPSEMSQGTFTVSNLGMHGVSRFTAIITPPQVAILAVGSALPRPVVRDGEVVVRRIVEVTLSSDHRAVDGVDAARFLDDLRSRLESGSP